MNTLRIACALTRILFVATTLTIGVAMSASAGNDPAPDWSTLAAENTVVVVTERPDGTPHDTTVWIAVTGGHGYLRTSDTGWFHNIERNRNVVLRAGEREWALTVEHVEDDVEGEAVMSAFREKYGISDLLIAPMLLGGSHLMRLEPRLVR